MKKIFTLTAIICLFIANVAMSQSPEKLSYQANVRNASGELVKNATVGVRITIYQGSENGTEVYFESHTPQTNENGLFSIEIGTGNTIGNFSSIDWSAGPYFLKTDIDPAGATNYTISGTSELISVPYALYAKEAGNGFSGDYSDLTNAPDLTGMISIAGPAEGDMAVFKDGNWNSLIKGQEGNILAISGNQPAWKPLGLQNIQGNFQFATFEPGTANPIAFGFINADGTTESGSGNYTSTWNAASGCYEITITNESYFWKSYATLITLSSSSSTSGAFARVGSVSGKMLVYISK